MDEETTMGDGFGNEPTREEGGTTPGAGTPPQETSGAATRGGTGVPPGAEAPSHETPQAPHAGAGQWPGQGAAPGGVHGVYGAPGQHGYGPPPGQHGYGPPPGQHGYGPQDPYGPYGYVGQGPYDPGQPWQHAQGAGGGWGWGGQGGWPPPAPAGGPPGGRRARRLLAAGTASLVALAAVAVGVGIGYDVWSGATAPASSTAPRGSTGATGRAGTAGVTSATPSRKQSAATGSPSNLTAVVGKVAPGIVDVNTVLGYDRAEAAGTGMVLTSTGKVLTNNHVIEGSTSISVTDIGNGKTYHASVVGYDKAQDVAVIQLKGASGLATVTTGNSANMKIGQPVVGIGNAGGTGGTPSVAGGSVTGLNKSITASDQGTFGTTVEHLTGLIESNCNIQPGDSGGPLVNETGTVLGMDTAASAAEGYRFSGASTGQGYSIPINTAASIAKQIMHGKSSSTVHIGGTGFLGVYVGTVPTDSPNRIGSGGLTVTPRTFTPVLGTTASGAATGAYVSQVIRGTPAQAAGLGKGDVITAVAGTTVTSANGLTKIMMKYHPGSKVTVTWTAPTGATHSATVTLGTGPAD